MKEKENKVSDGKACRKDLKSYHAKRRGKSSPLVFTNL